MFKGRSQFAKIASFLLGALLPFSGHAAFCVEISSTSPSGGTLTIHSNDPLVDPVSLNCADSSHNYVLLSLGQWQGIFGPLAAELEAIDAEYPAVLQSQTPAQLMRAGAEFIDSGGESSGPTPTALELAEAWGQGFFVALPVLLVIYGGRRVLASLNL